VFPTKTPTIFFFFVCVCVESVYGEKKKKKELLLIKKKKNAADGKDSFPLVMVGGVLEANKRWDIGKEVINYISKDYPGVQSIRPKVSILHIHLSS
jgi:hypothetical protein